MDQAHSHLWDTKPDVNVDLVPNILRSTLALFQETLDQFSGRRASLSEIARQANWPMPYLKELLPLVAEHIEVIIENEDGNHIITLRKPNT